MNRLFPIALILLTLALGACSRPGESPAQPTAEVAPTEPPAATATSAPTATPTPLPDELAEAAPAEEILLYYPAALIPPETMTEIAESFSGDIGSGIEVRAEPYSDTVALAELLEEATPSLLLAMGDDLPAGVEGADLAPFIESARWGIDDDAAEALAASEARSAFPLLHSVMALYFDPPLLAQLDLELPESWDELLDDACEARDNERTGAVLYPDARLLAAMTGAGGGTLYDGERFDLTSEATLDAAAALAQLTARGCANLTGRPYGNEPPPPSGPPLFSFGPLGQPPLAVVDPARPDEIGVAPLPTGGEPMPGLPLLGLLTAADENEQLAAWLFLRWLHTPAQQTALAEASGLLPAHAEAELPEALAAFDGAVDASAPALVTLPEEARLLVEEALVQIIGGADPEATFEIIAGLLGD